jgi:glycosyltransferase involved in cell wall biosynthesis
MAVTLGEDIESTKVQLRRRISEGGIDVIFGHGVEAAPIIELAAAERIPSVWHLPEGIENINPSVGDPASAKQYLKLRRLLELPYRVVYNNPATHSAIVGRQTRGGNADYIEAALFDADLDINRREAVREDWGVTDRQVAFLAVVPPVESEWETILSAFHRVADEDGFLFLVLHGETTDEIDRAIFGLLRQLRDNVAVLINPTRLHYLYQAADVYVAHPRADLRSIEMLRALEHRLPLVGTEAMVQAQILVPGVNGEAATAHRPGELARAMYRVIRDPERRRRYSEAARDYLKSRSHSETVLAQWRDLLVEAAELNERQPMPMPVEAADFAQSTEAGTLAEISSIDRLEKTG